MTVQSEAEMRKLALTSLAGTSIEWFDFFFEVILAPFLGYFGDKSTVKPLKTAIT